MHNKVRIMDSILYGIIYLCAAFSVLLLVGMLFYPGRNTKALFVKSKTP